MKLSVSRVSGSALRALDVLACKESARCLPRSYVESSVDRTGSRAAQRSALLDGVPFVVNEEMDAATRDAVFVALAAGAD